MDDAYYAQKALDRAKRADQRAKQRVADDQFLAAFDKRFAQREAHREARDDSIAKVESEVRVRQVTRASTTSTAEDPSVAAERARKVREEEAERQRAREEAKARRDQERAEAEAKEQATAAQEEKARKEREAERQRAREESERQAAEVRQAEEAARQRAREDKIQAQREEQVRLDEERRAAAAKRESERLAKEQAEEEERKARQLAREEEARRAEEQREQERLAKEEARKTRDAEAAKRAADEAQAAAQRKAQAEEAARAAELARKAEQEAARQEQERVAAEKAVADKKAEDDRLASEKVAADKKAEEDRIATEKAAADKKAEEEAAQIREEERRADEARQEQERLDAEKKKEDEAHAAELAALKKKEDEDEAERIRIEEEEAILKADEARLAAEEAKDAVSEDNDADSLDEEEAALLAEEEAMRLEEETLKREEEEENLRLMAEEEAELAKMEAEEATAAADAKKAEEDRIAAEKAEEDRLLAEEKAEEDRLATEKAAADKKAEDDRIAAEKLAAEKAAPEPAAEAPAPAASKKAAFLAALNNKIGLGGPPPKTKPSVAVEDSPAAASPTSTSSASTTENDASNGVDLLGEAAAPRLAPLTHARAKGPNRNHRATLAGIRSRMDADGNQSFFVGDVQATPHVDGQSVREAEDALSATPSAAAEESAPAQRKLPPGAMAMPGMGLGGLMGAIKKSADRRASVAAPSISGSSSPAPETKLPPVRLIHVRGKGKELFVRLVEPTLSAMSHDSAFILEDVKGSVLYVWSGYNANKMQTTKCLDLVSRINRGEHAGRAQTNTLRAGEETDAFWKLLGATPAPALTKTIPQTNTLPIVTDTLFRVDPTEEGSFVLFELGSETKNLDRGLLWSDACYVLDSGYEVRVWIGKSSPKEMRDAAMSQANELLSKPTKNGDARPAWSQVVYKEADRGETALFTDKFAVWPAEHKPKLAAAPPSLARAANAALENLSKPTNGATPSGSPSKATNGSPAKPTNARLAPYDGATMAAIERPASADKVLPDEGIHGHFTAWIQDGFEKKPYPKSRIGIYDDAHCYISMYSWGLTGSERHMVYFWQGQATTPNDQGSVAGLAREINERICKGSGQLVRVPEFHENEHFLLCHSTQKQPYVSLGASLNGSVDGKTVRFIHVRGRSANNAKAHQVQVDASALNTNDVFIVILDAGKSAPFDAEAPYLSDTKEVFIWQGRESNDFLRQYAKETVARLAGASFAPQIVEEGSETAPFWTLVGQQASSKPTYITGRQADYDLKIYMCTANSQEGFKIGRIWDYSNFDVCSDRVLIVEDSTHHVFVWMGSRTAEPERKLSLESALSYAKTVSAPAPVVYMYEGHETLQFKSLFHGWTTKQPLDTKAVAGNGEVEKLLPLYQSTFSLAQLKDRSALPPTVDQANLEYHLNEDDFTAALKMTRDAFFALPEWKRLEAKKSSPIY